LKVTENTVTAFAVFPDERRMVTSSFDKTLRLWDSKDGVVLKKKKGHGSGVQLSGDGQMIASGDKDGDIIAWHGDTGESLFTESILGRSNGIPSLDSSPDSAVLASGSWDQYAQLWSTKTWQVHCRIGCAGAVFCVRYSPSGELAIAAGRLK
jgi:WD40 repeat protein